MPNYNQTETAFKGLLDNSDDPIGLCFKLVLIWIALCDGGLDQAEHSFLQKVFGSGGLDNDIDRLGEIIKLEVFDLNSVDSLEVASRFLKNNIDSKGKRMLMEMIVGISIANGRLSISENHVLRFLSDLFEFDTSEFEEIFSDIAGLNFPLPGNPGNKDWWEEKLGKNQDSEQGDSHNAVGEDSEVMPAPVALRILGLHGNPSKSEIKAAYRKLAKRHHPDKFARLGTNAMHFSNSIFLRIKQAYEALNKR